MMWFRGAVRIAKLMPFSLNICFVFRISAFVILHVIRWCESLYQCEAICIVFGRAILTNAEFAQ